MIWWISILFFIKKESELNALISKSHYRVTSNNSLFWNFGWNYQSKCKNV